MTWRSVNNKEKFTVNKLFMHRFHKINQCFRIKICLGNLKEKMAFYANSRSNCNVNAFFARNTSNWFNIWKSPCFSHMGNQFKNTLISIKNQSLRLKSRSCNLGKFISFPSSDFLNILFQRSPLRAFTHQSQSSQKSWHIISVHLYAKPLSYKGSHTRSCPEIRGKTVINCWLSQYIHQFKNVFLLKFRRGSCCLSRFQLFKTMSAISSTRIPRFTMRTAVILMISSVLWLMLYPYAMLLV